MEYSQSVGLFEENTIPSPQGGEGKYEKCQSSANKFFEGLRFSRAVKLIFLFFMLLNILGLGHIVLSSLSNSDENIASVEYIVQTTQQQYTPQSSNIEEGDLTEITMNKWWPYMTIKSQFDNQSLHADLLHLSIATEKEISHPRLDAKNNTKTVLHAFVARKAVPVYSSDKNATAIAQYLEPNDVVLFRRSFGPWIEIGKNQYIRFEPWEGKKVATVYAALLAKQAIKAEDTSKWTREHQCQLAKEKQNSNTFPDVCKIKIKLEMATDYLFHELKVDEMLGEEKRLLSIGGRAAIQREMRNALNRLQKITPSEKEQAAVALVDKVFYKTFP